MEINFKEYLSEDEIKDIVIDEFRSQLQAVFKQEKELERVMGNLAYHIIQEELEKIYVPSNLQPLDQYQPLTIPDGTNKIS